MRSLERFDLQRFVVVLSRFELVKLWSQGKKRKFSRMFLELEAELLITGNILGYKGITPSS